MKRTKKILSAILALVIGLGCFPLAPAYAEDGADVYDTMRLKLYDMIVGADYDPAEEWTGPIIAAIDQKAREYWDSMNKNPVSNAINGSYRDDNDQLFGGDSSQDYLWADRPLGKRGTTSGCWYESNNIQWGFTNLKAMALAYKTVGSSLYGNQELLDDVLMGVKFLYDNHFNPNVKNYGNWYGWELGCPLNFAEILVMLYDEFPPQEMEDYASMLVHYLGKKSSYTGANGLWAERVRMYAGILLKDSTWLDFVKTQLPKYYTYATGKDGYHTDGTFIQHEVYPYNNGYGISSLTDSAFMLHMLSGTPWDMGSDYNEIIYQWLYDSYETVVYDGLAMDSFRGREITREASSQASGGISIANTLLMMSENAPADVKADFLGMVKQWFSNDYMKEQLNQTIGGGYFSAFNSVGKVNRILADDSIAPRKLVANIQMGVGARAVHHAEDFAYEISMTSKRIKSYEGGDSNVRGWYTGNGMTYLYNGDMSRYEGTVKPTIDWYRLPGATAVYGKSQAISLNSRSFTGGTTLKGLYGATGMDFQVEANNLEMKKSWFQFADAIVALGSDISGSGQVETTLENYPLDADNRTFSVDGQQREMQMDGKRGSFRNAKTLHITGNTEGSDIGFYFPEGNDVYYVSETRTGKFSDFGASNSDSTEYSRDYFTAWLAHGNSPEAASYSYVLLPGKSDAELTSYAEANTIEILQNDSRAHAVYEKALDVVGVNFWEDGSNILAAKGLSNYIYSDSAASIMVGESNEGIDISVSDATQENDGYINLEINRAAAGVLSADEGVEVVQTSPTIQLRVNVKDAAGKSFTASLSYKEAAPQAPEIQSAEMIDGALVVKMSSTGGQRYEVRYGAESGSYTQQVGAGENEVKIYGLTPGQTYYLAAVSMNGDAESSLSAEMSYTVPLTVQFVDEFEDMSKMLSYSDGWAYENAGNPGAFQGDLTRLWRSAQTSEYFTYMLPALEDFALDVFGYGKSVGQINVYTSADGETWTPQATKDEGETPIGEWFKRVVTPDGPLNADADYIKIELASHPNRTWAPQFTRFSATLRNDSDQKLLQDSLLNDQRMYTASQVEFFQNSDPAAFGGDGELVKAQGTDNQILYSWTHMTDIAVKAYVKAGTLTAEVSQDGEAFQPVTLAADAGETDAGGYQAVTFTADTLPENTNYVRLHLGEDVAIGEVTLRYQPANMPIQKVRFTDSALDGIIGYDTVPEIRVAPMNGTGQLEYAVLNENLATFDGGALSFHAQGTTRAVVTATDSGATAELPLTIYKNLALKQTASASSSHNLYPPRMGVDGDLSSGWQSGAQEAEWYAVDLGAPVTFDAVDIVWSSKGQEYVIEASDDGQSYTPIVTVADANAGGGREVVRHTLDTPKTARYVRMRGVTPYQYSITEFRILQKEGLDTDNTWNLALHKEVTVSSVDASETTLTAPLAVDGNETTRWGSNRNDDEWFVVDLGETSQVAAVNILWETACGKEYKIQISDNRETWTDMVHETAGAAGWMRYSLNTLYSGRYVRMQGISRGTKYGYSIYEFQVMGTNASGSQPDPITTLTLEPENLTLLQGQSYTLTAQADRAFNAASIRWESSDSDVVTVSAGGKVSATGATGSAVITAASVLDADIQASCTVTVAEPAGTPVPVEGIQITAAPDGEPALGDTFILQAAVSPADATNPTVVWESDNPAVAVVNAAGKLTVLQYGKALITACSVASGQTDTYLLEAVNREPYYDLVVEQPAVGSAAVTTDPAGSAQSKSTVTVEVTGVEAGYTLTGIGVSQSGDDVEVKEITTDVPAGARRFTFTMPAGPVSITALLQADTGALEALMEKAGELDENAYNAASWSSLQRALSRAESLVSDGRNVTKADVETAIKRLQDALDGLVPAEENLDTLDALIAEAEGLDEMHHTAESWENIREALEAARQADRADKAAVESAAAALRKALGDKVEAAAGSGDLDRDGALTITDVMATCKVLARMAAGEKSAPSEIRLADLDNDGMITINDVMCICKLLARKA